MVPETRYASLGRDRIAYQVWGHGEQDLLCIPSIGTSIDLRWDWPPYAGWLGRLASFTRLIIFDRRGCGASDPVADKSTSAWDRWADDAQAVLDTVGSERAALLALSDSGPVAVRFAAAHPQRTRGLVLCNTAARFVTDIDYPWGISPADFDTAVELLERMWGTEEVAQFGNPDAAKDPAFCRWHARMNRWTISARDAAAYYRWLGSIDLRAVLPNLHIPTLVLHRQHARWITPEQGRDLAGRIPEAHFAVVPGADLMLSAAPTGAILHYIEEFLAGGESPKELDRALAAIMFTDIVNATRRAAAAGDREWRQIIESHDDVSRTIVDQHQGRFVKTTGDGMLATFDGPGRAIACADALRHALQPLGLAIRAGVHTGEVELTHGDLAGIGVHTAARVVELARPGEVLVSRTVRDVLAGSGIDFDDRGEYELKGVPGTWQLFKVHR